MSKFIIKIVIVICCFTLSYTYAEEIESIGKAKVLLSAKLLSLQDSDSDKILVTNMELGLILTSFSNMKFTFGELAYEFLCISKKLNKPIIFKDASSVFNKYKDNINQKFTKFETIEYNGTENHIIMKFTPNSEDEQFYVEAIDGKDIYQKEETMLNVTDVNERKVKVKTGILTADEVFINRGISFKFREGDEKVDSKSILGVLPKTELILILEGDLKGEKLDKGTFIQVIAKKYGGVDKCGDYIILPASID